MAHLFFKFPLTLNFWTLTPPNWHSFFPSNYHPSRSNLFELNLWTVPRSQSNYMIILEYCSWIFRLLSFFSISVTRRSRTPVLKVNELVYEFNVWSRGTWHVCWEKLIDLLQAIQWVSICKSICKIEKFGTQERTCKSLFPKRRKF